MIMNKKFSTLVASLLLATTVGTVSATTDKGVASSFPREVAAKIDGKFYQLSDGYNVLAMEKTSDGKFILKFVPYSDAELAKTLWEIKAMENKDEKGLAFQFYNVSTGLPLSFDSDLAVKYGSSLTATKLSQGVASWSWIRGTEGDPLMNAASIESFFGEKRDSVMTLMNTAEGVAAVKYATKDQASVSGNVQVKPMKASPVYLNSYDLNTMLQTSKSKLHLNFTPNVSADATVNAFTGADGTREFIVTDAVGTNSLSLGSVRDAETDVKEKNAILEGVQNKLDAANAEITALGGDKETATKNFAAAKQVHQDALDEQTTVQENRNKAARKIKRNIQKRDAVLAQYETALKLEGADEVALEKATTEKNNAEDAFEAAEGIYLPIETEYNGLVEEQTKASDAKDIAKAEYSKSNRNVSYLKTLTALAVNESSGSGTDLVAGWAGNKSYTSLQRNDPTAAKALADHLNGIADLADYTQTVADAFLLPYENVNKEKKTAYFEANKVYQTAEKAVEAKKSAYEEAKTAYEDAKLVYKDADDTYQALLAQYESSSAESTRLWNEVKKFQSIIDENEVIRDAADDRLAELKDEIPALWAEVERTGDVLAETVNEFGALVETLTKLNEEYHIAWYKWNDAVKYLASLDGTDEYWYSLQAADGSYLMVDTAYLESSSSDKHQTFNLKKKYEAAEIKYPGMEKLTARDINGRFNFKFLYYPTIDSLVIMADGGNDKPVNNKTWWHYRPISSVVGKNYVKLAVLGSGENAHREVTLGAPYQIYTGTPWPQQTLNTRISLGLIKNTQPATLTPGLYHMDVVNRKNVQKNGARLMTDLDGYSLTKVAPAEWDVMEFAHMPAAKWIVTETPVEFGGYPEIRNQETGRYLNNGAYEVLEDNENEAVVVLPYWYNYDEDNFVLESDTFKLTKAESNTLGYYAEKAENVNFTFNYLSVANDGLSITIGNSTIGQDTILRVSADDKTKFELEAIHITKYGLPYETDTLKQGVYYIRVNDPYKFANQHKYVQVSSVDGTEMIVVGDKLNASLFTLKEVNCIDGVHYYALLTYYPDGIAKKAGVIDASGLIKAENLKYESTTSAFALVADTTALYREFTADELGENGAMKFYRVNSTEKAYLYEGANSLLCVEGKGDNAAEAFNVISTGVENTLMPQYLIAKDVNFVAGETTLCDICGKPDCEHSFATKDTTFGRFLVNMIDSVPAVKKYTWEGKYKRLAFLPGYIANDTLTIEGTTKVVGLSKVNQHDATKFSFRLVNDESNDFLIESESYKKTAFDGGIAPSANMGGWVKVQNGVPVIINDFEAAMQSDLYNVDTNAGDATANEDIEVSAVTVIAGEGQVTIAGAAGKKVVVTNILGQTVATQVLTSDNAVIAAPQGVVVVAVEGEEAVKAIVK